MRRCLILILGFLPLFSFEYVVKKGDCLWDLAGRFYKDPFLWPIIYEANKDKIKDPNLIYPWQRFEIPPLEKKEMVKEVVEEKPKETGISTPEVVEAPKIEIEKKIEVVSVLEEKKPPVEEARIEKTRIPEAEGTRFIKTAGFLTIEDIHEGEIKESRGTLKNTALLHDEVLLDLGSLHGINKEDMLTIIDYGSDVSDPETGEYLGKKVFMLGKVKIIETDSINSIGEIVEQYSPILLPAKVARIELPEFPKGKPEPIGTLLEGRIVGFRDEKPRYRLFDVVYIVPGKNQVKPGDIFLIYRETEEENIPIRPCGKIQVLSVWDNHSVGYILSLEETYLHRGERLKLVGRIR